MALPVASPSPRRLRARWLGTVPYGEAYDLQRSIFERRGEGLVDDYLLLLEHPHVFTLGRRATSDHLLLPASRYEELGAEVVVTDRGGAVTYHGPGQLVAYPIVRLSKPDVVGYVRALEEAVIALLASLGIKGERNKKNSGVWVGGSKICAVGVRVGRGSTMHGLALNVSTDLSYFDLIVPCGLQDAGVTSIERESGMRLSPAELALPLARELQKALGFGSLDFAATAPKPRPDRGVGVVLGAGGGGRDQGPGKRVGGSSPPRAADGSPRPSYLRVKARMGPEFASLKRLMRSLELHTVCEEASCPNIYECWSEGTATVMILGDTCTRACGFCNVSTGRPQGLDLEEPWRVAQAVAEMGLDHAVVTSVARDDLSDGGASVFAETIRAIRETSPACRVEVLVPDFKGDPKALGTVLSARPDVLNHNLETVARLQKAVRGVGGYARSLTLLARAASYEPRPLVKSGLMVGLGESMDEVLQAMADLRAVGTDILTVGQYLQPSCRHLQVQRWWTLEEFERLRKAGLEMGFSHVEAGPLVRSSYHAKRAVTGAGALVG